MPNINDINTEVYKLLIADVTLGGLCTVYKGGRRPSQASNPSVTVEAKRLEPGEGEGIWMCDVVTSAYVDMLANGMPDHETLENIVSQLDEILADTEITITDAKALPLIKGTVSGPDWTNTHSGETSQENTYGLIFVHFGGS